MPEKVDQPNWKSPLLAGWRKEMELSRALMGGTRRMREAGKRFLPQFPKEKTPAWEARRDGAFLFNGYKHGVMGMVGKVFRKVPQITAPARLEPWLEDVDLDGTGMYRFAREAFQELVETGAALILVDFPESAQGFNLEEEEALKIRPYLNMIPADRLLGFTVEQRFGIRRLARVRFEESTVEPVGRFGQKVVTQVRVLVAGPIFVDPEVPRDDPARFARIETWREDEKKEGVWQMVSVASLAPHVDIPLVPILAERQGYLIGRSPLEELAWKNVEHWQSSSDQRSILHTARVPILEEHGVGDAGSTVTELGSGVLFSYEEPQAGLSYVEHTGQAIGAGERDLENLKDEMAVMAGRAMADAATGKETATQKVLDAKDATSHLEAMARVASIGLTEATRLMAQWASLDARAEITLNTDFGLSAEELEEVRTLLAAYEVGGVISAKTVRQKMEQAKMLPEEWTEENEQLRLAEESGANPPPAVTPPGALPQEIM